MVFLVTELIYHIYSQKYRYKHFEYYNKYQYLYKILNILLIIYYVIFIIQLVLYNNYKLSYIYIITNII